MRKKAVVPKEEGKKEKEIIEAAEKGKKKPHDPCATIA